MSTSWTAHLEVSELNMKVLYLDMPFLFQAQVLELRSLQNDPTFVYHQQSQTSYIPLVPTLLEVKCGEPPETGKSCPLGPQPKPNGCPKILS